MAEFIQNFNWWSLIDVVAFLIVAILIMVFFQRRNSIRLAIFTAIYLLLYVGVSVASGLRGNGFLYVTRRIFQYTTIFLIVVFAVVYQSDFKVLVNKMAHGKKGDKYDIDLTEEQLSDSAGEIVKACQNMSKNDVGALIIIIKTAVPDHLLDSGTSLEADVSSGLLESIFSTKGPLHDGAVIIKGSKVLSAACFLPLSQKIDIAKELGTRHRAAIGITEQSDVFAIVVSEETGIISTVEDGVIKRYMTPEKLFESIKQAFGILPQPAKEKKKEKRKFL